MAAWAESQARQCERGRGGVSALPVPWRMNSALSTSRCGWWEKWRQFQRWAITSSVASDEAAENGAYAFHIISAGEEIWHLERVKAR